MQSTTELLPVIEDAVTDPEHIKFTLLLVLGQSTHFLNVTAFDALFKLISFVGISLYAAYMAMSVLMKWKDFKKNLPLLDEPEEEQPN